MLVTPELVDETSGTSSSARPTWRPGPDARPARRDADRRPGDHRRAERRGPADRAARAAADAPDASPEWERLRENSTGWVPITFPLGRLGGPRGRPARGRRFPDLRGSFDPEVAISLLIRSQRRPVGRPARDRLRDVARSEQSTPQSTVRTSANFVTRLEPGVRVGLGYDGQAGNLERRGRAPPGRSGGERGDRCGSSATTGGRSRPDLRAALRHARRRPRPRPRRAPARARASRASRWPAGPRASASS